MTRGSMLTAHKNILILLLRPEVQDQGAMVHSYYQWQTNTAAGMHSFVTFKSFGGRCHPNLPWKH